MFPLKPNEQRAKNAILLIWIIVAIETFSMLSSYLQLNLLHALNNGIDISTEQINANDTREQIVGFLYIVAFIVSIVTFIQWFRRAYYNLHQKTIYLSQSEGMAAGSWFIPFINLYRPFQIMKELYVKTKELLTEHEIEITTPLKTSIVGWWWTLWVIHNIFGRIIFNYSRKADQLHELITVTQMSIISGVIGIVLAFLIIKIIKDYAKVEPLLHEIPEEDTNYIEQQPS